MTTVLPQVAALCIFAGFVALLAATVAAGMLGLALLSSSPGGDGTADTKVCAASTVRCATLVSSVSCILLAVQ